MEQKAYLYKKIAYLYKEKTQKKALTDDHRQKNYLFQEKKNGPKPDAKFRKDFFSSPTSGYEVHAPIKFDWLGVIIGYPYTHSIPHPPPIVNYFFKKIISKAKKNACHARGKESMFNG